MEFHPLRCWDKIVGITLDPLSSFLSYTFQSLNKPTFKIHPEFYHLLCPLPSLVPATIIFFPDYYNSFLTSFPSSSMTPLQTILNTAARVTVLKTWIHHVNLLLKTLIASHFRVSAKTFIMAYNILSNFAFHTPFHLTLSPYSCYSLCFRYPGYLALYSLNIAGTPPPQVFCLECSSLNYPRNSFIFKFSRGPQCDNN